MAVQGAAGGNQLRPCTAHWTGIVAALAGTLLSDGCTASAWSEGAGVTATAMPRSTRWSWISHRPTSWSYANARLTCDGWLTVSPDPLVTTNSMPPAQVAVASSYA